MNHHYPDGYHNYVRATAGMGYGHNAYEDPTNMGRMGHPRANYHMPHYHDGGQIHPMMQQQGGMYAQGSYMTQQSAGNMYNMGGYSNYGMSGIDPTSMGNNSSMMMGSQRNMSSYYSHPIDPHSTQHGSVPVSHHPPSFSNPTSTGSMPCSNQMNNPMQTQNPSIGQTQAMSMPNMQQAPTSVSHHGLPTNQTAGGFGSGQQGGTNPTHVTMHQGGQGHQRSMMGSSSAGSHPIPQHPMRHQNNQQNPQEVADNILQIASSYPSNNTVQVPLKNRPAPYHIPRSPHFNMPSSELPHSSTMVNPVQHTSPTSQPSPTPSSSSVKSPTPALVPIPNPIASPGISSLRSPCSQGQSPCGAQRSPAHKGSTYSGHGQNVSSPQFSPGNPGHSGMTQYSPCPSATFSPHSDSSKLPDHVFQSGYSNYPCLSSSPKVSSMSQTPSQQTSSAHFSQAGNGNNPLMSLQKLVMLPETQVVDPKSVVNDACLSQANESAVVPKNVEDPAERQVEDSGLSVGFSGQSSPQRNHSGSHATVTPNASEGGTTDTCDVNQNCQIEGSSIDLEPDTSLTEKSNLKGNQNSLVDGDPDSVKDNDTKSTQVDAPSCDKVSKIDESDVFKMDIANFDSSSVNFLSVSAELDCAQLDSKPLTESKVVQLDSGSEIEPCDKSSGSETKETASSLIDSSNSIDVQNSRFTNNGVLDDILMNCENCDTNFLSRHNKRDSADVCHNNNGSSLVSNEPESNLEARFEISQNVEKLESLSQDQQNGVSSDGISFKSLDVTKIKPNLRKDVAQNIVLANGVEKGFESNGHLKNQPCARKNGKPILLNEKQAVMQCDPPGVLSEVPLLINGSTCPSEEVGQDYDGDLHVQFQKSFTSLVCSKLGLLKKTNHLARLTPCSITVGADEREACERFAFRRNNGYCRALRRSRVLCNGRSRQDSTGNGDSDESLENVSDSNHHVLGNPQDGNKKRAPGAATRNEYRKSNGSRVRASGSDGYSTRTNTSRTTSNINDSTLYDNGVTDEEGDVCYYEGVDSSDFFMNNINSDDSISSNEKQNDHANPISETQDFDSKTSLETPEKGMEVDQNKEQNQNKEAKERMKSASPPSKRLCGSSGLKRFEKCMKAVRSKEESITTALASSSEFHSGNEDVTCSLYSSLGVQENGQESRLQSLQPSGQQSSSTEKLNPKLLEAVVVLEKSKVSNSQSATMIKIEKAEAHTHSVVLPATFFKGETENSVSGTDSSIHGAVKSEPSIPESGKAKSTTDIAKSSVGHEFKSAQTRKRMSSKRKRKGKAAASIPSKGRYDEVKDSFKSMKFNRTLDLMKSQRRKDIIPSGPFIRLEGKRDMPQTITIFNQSPQDLLLLSSGHKKQSTKTSHIWPAASSTIHMMTNLPSDKTVMHSSVRINFQQQWSCAFCSHRSSYQFLGDLFGPYYKEDDLVLLENVTADDSRKGDGKSGVTSSSSLNKQKEISPERKGVRSRKTQNKPEPAQPEEIWLHESCALWAPGVYLVGSKIYGLNEALSDTSETVCSVCEGKGAMIGCLHKGCTMKYHYICAVEKDCYLDEGNLSLLCPKHKDKKSIATYPSSMS